MYDSHKIILPTVCIILGPFLPPGDKGRQPRGLPRRLLLRAALRLRSLRGEGKGRGGLLGVVLLLRKPGREGGGVRELLTFI